MQEQRPRSKTESILKKKPHITVLTPKKSLSNTNANTNTNTNTNISRKINDAIEKEVRNVGRQSGGGGDGEEHFRERQKQKLGGNRNNKSKEVKKKFLRVVSSWDRDGVGCYRDGNGFGKQQDGDKQLREQSKSINIMQTLHKYLQTKIDHQLPKTSDPTQTPIQALNIFDQIANQQNQDKFSKTHGAQNNNQRQNNQFRNKKKNSQQHLHPTQNSLQIKLFPCSNNPNTSPPPTSSHPQPNTITTNLHIVRSPANKQTSPVSIINTRNYPYHPHINIFFNTALHADMPQAQFHGQDVNNQAGFNAGRDFVYLNDGGCRGRSRSRSPNGEILNLQIIDSVKVNTNICSNITQRKKRGKIFTNTKQMATERYMQSNNNTQDQTYMNGHQTNINNHSLRNLYMGNNTSSGDRIDTNSCNRTENICNRSLILNIQTDDQPYKRTVITYTPTQRKNYVQQKPIYPKCEHRNTSADLRNMNRLVQPQSQQPREYRNVQKIQVISYRNMTSINEAVSNYRNDKSMLINNISQNRSKTQANQVYMNMNTGNHTQLTNTNKINKTIN